MTEMFRDGEIDELYMGFTTFVSMLNQEAEMIPILPITNVNTERTDAAKVLTIYEPESEALFDIIVPQYVAGLIHGGVAESWASEVASRRTAMDAASKNAAEMVDSLSLSYNRARQAAITQEITEIVSGAGAL